MVFGTNFEANNNPTISTYLQKLFKTGTTSSGLNDADKAWFGRFNTNNNKGLDADELKNIMGCKDVTPNSNGYNAILNNLTLPGTNTKLDSNKIQSIVVYQNGEDETSSAKEGYVTVTYKSDDGSTALYTYATNPVLVSNPDEAEDIIANTKFEPIEKREVKNGIETVTAFDNKNDTRTVTKGALTTTYDNLNRITSVKTDKGNNLATLTNYEYDGDSTTPSKQIDTDVQGNTTTISENIKNPNIQQTETKGTKGTEKAASATSTDSTKKKNNNEAKQGAYYANKGESFKDTIERLGFKEGSAEYEAIKKANPEAVKNNAFNEGQQIIIPDSLKSKVLQQNNPNDKKVEKQPGKNEIKPEAQTFTAATDQKDKPDKPDIKGGEKNGEPVKVEGKAAPEVSQKADDQLQGNPADNNQNNNRIQLQRNQDH